MKTCGAVERPKQRAKKWKTLPNSMNRRKYPEHGGIGKNRYTTMRMMNLAHEARELILAATTPRPVDRKLTAVKAQRRKRSQLEGSLSEQRLHRPGQGFAGKMWRQKTITIPFRAILHRRDRISKPEIIQRKSHNTKIITVNKRSL